MDNQLQDCITRLNLQNDKLAIIRNEYLTAESTRKHYEARLIAMAQGKSNAEKTINAQATESWRTLALSLARLEADLEFNKLKLSILSQEYQAVYLSLKIDSEVMRKS